MSTSPIDRVRKLIALTASPNDNEARNAAMLACRMIRESNGAIVLAVGHAAAPSPPRPAPPPAPRAARHETNTPGRGGSSVYGSAGGGGAGVGGTGGAAGTYSADFPSTMSAEEFRKFMRDMEDLIGAAVAGSPPRSSGQPLTCPRCGRPKLVGACSWCITRDVRDGEPADPFEWKVRPDFKTSVDYGAAFRPDGPSPMRVVACPTCCRPLPFPIGAHFVTCGTCDTRVGEPGVVWPDTSQPAAPERDVIDLQPRGRRWTQAERERIKAGLKSGELISVHTILTTAPTRGRCAKCGEDIMPGDRVGVPDEKSRAAAVYPLRFAMVHADCRKSWYEIARERPR